MKISEQESEGGMDGRSGEGERKGEIKKRRMRERERERMRNRGGRVDIGKRE